jgi:cellulose synthase/poly-beta-1,6-N-acetylglucosamine synthase-like glycosyltransferase
VKEPVVSVLLPARDAAATLPACLASIARQIETDFECVVVDDGSRDETRAIADAFARRDPRFRVVALAPRGIVGALNEGLSACRGRWVARMDADDLMHRDRLAAQLAALEADPTLTGVGCHVRCFPRSRLQPGLRDYEAWLRAIDGPRRVAVERFVECPLPHPTWMLRREVAEAIGWRDREWPEDWDFLLRLFASGRRMGIVPRRLLAWRDRPARLWRTHAAYAPARLVACKAHHLASGPLRHTDAYLLWGHGETGKALRRALAAEGKRAAAIVEVHPRRLGQTIGGALVVRPERIPSLPRLPLVACVAGAAARAEIRAACARMGLRDGVDFVAAA